MHPPSTLADAALVAEMVVPVMSSQTCQTFFVHRDTARTGGTGITSIQTNVAPHLRKKKILFIV